MSHIDAVTEDRVVIPVDAEGCLVDGARVIGKSDGNDLFVRYRAVLESRQSIDFVVREHIDHLSPGFFLALLGEVLKNHMDVVEKNASKWSCEEMDDMTNEGRIRFLFDPVVSPAGDNEENMKQRKHRDTLRGKSAHDFLSFIGPHNKLLSYRRHAKFIDMFRPDDAEAKNRNNVHILDWKRKFQATLRLV